MPECNTSDPPRKPAGLQSLRAEPPDPARQHDPVRRGIPRQRNPAIEVWRLQRDGRVQSCELRDDSRAGAGSDVLMFEDGDPLFSRRCLDERGARYIAESFRKDLLRNGWTP